MPDPQVSLVSDATERRLMHAVTAGVQVLDRQVPFWTRKVGRKGAKLINMMLPTECLLKKALSTKGYSLALAKLKMTRDEGRQCGFDVPLGLIERSREHRRAVYNRLGEIWREIVLTRLGPATEGEEDESPVLALHELVTA